MIDKIGKYLAPERHYNIAVLLILVFMTAAMMFFYSPFCPGGDFFVHYNRFVVLMEAIADGSFPVYMDYYMIDSYGYLIKAFYSDFLLIPFALVGNLTTPVFAYQTMIFTFTFLCGLFTFMAVKRITKDRFAAIITALLYTFAAYRIFDVYIRQALGESMSFTILPLVLWGAYEIIKGNYKKWYILTIAFCLLIFSHVISTILTSIILFIFICVYYKSFLKEKQRIYYLLLAAIACLPLTAYYIFPMIEQMLSNSFYYSTHPLIDGVWGYRLHEVVTGLFNEVSPRKEGLVPKLGAVLTFVIFLRVFVREKSAVMRFMDIGIILGLFFIFMTTPLFPWNIFPFSLLQFIQFPWRLIEYTSFFFALAGGYYISKLLVSRKRKMIAILGMVGMYILIFNSDCIHYRTFICNHYKENLSKNGDYSIEINTSFLGIIGGEYLPSRVPSNNFIYPIEDVFNDYIHLRGQIVKTEKQSTSIENFNKNKGHITFDVQTNVDDNLELPLTYYKGYRATIDDETVEYIQSENGLIKIPINKSGRVEIEYVGTTLQKICSYITLISILLFVIFIVINNRKNKQIKQTNI